MSYNIESGRIVCEVKNYINKRSLISELFYILAIIAFPNSEVVTCLALGVSLAKS